MSVTHNLGKDCTFQCLQGKNTLKRPTCTEDWWPLSGHVSLSSSLLFSTSQQSPFLLLLGLRPVFVGQLEQLGSYRKNLKCKCKSHFTFSAIIILATLEGPSKSKI